MTSLHFTARFLVIIRPAAPRVRSRWSAIASIRLPRRRVSTTDTPVVFLPLTIASTWPSAASGGVDSDYEMIAPYVFRFEYYYLLKNGSFSVTPWDSSSGHTTVGGMQDVA